jgi:purine-nucleoside phosphorylase
MENLFEKVKESKMHIEGKTSSKPKIGVILGSGLGGFGESINEPFEIEYADIPHFPVSTVKGHDGKLIFGKVGNIDILAMKGRFHFYEGYSMKEVVYPIYVMKSLGVEALIVTNACGGINRGFKPGTLMIIEDIINMFKDNPLMGKNDERFGPRFPDMSEPYDRGLISLAEGMAEKLGIEYEKGVYAGVTGPYYETAAEIRMLDAMGADTVGMSTVPETIMANYLGMKVLGISCVTNMATGIRKEKHSHEGVVETANAASERLSAWVDAIIPEML